MKQHLRTVGSGTSARIEDAKTPPSTQSHSMKLSSVETHFNTSLDMNNNNNNSQLFQQTQNTAAPSVLLSSYLNQQPQFNKKPTTNPQNSKKPSSSTGGNRQTDSSTTTEHTNISHLPSTLKSIPDTSDLLAHSRNMSPFSQTQARPSIALQKLSILLEGHQSMSQQQYLQSQSNQQQQHQQQHQQQLAQYNFPQKPTNPSSLSQSYSNNNTKQTEALRASFNSSFQIPRKPSHARTSTKKPSNLLDDHLFASTAIHTDYSPSRKIISSSATTTEPKTKKLNTEGSITQPVSSKHQQKAKRDRNVNVQLSFEESIMNSSYNNNNINNNGISTTLGLPRPRMVMPSTTKSFASRQYKHHANNQSVSNRSKERQLSTSQNQSTINGSFVDTIRTPTSGGTKNLSTQNEAIVIVPTTKSSISNSSASQRSNAGRMHTSIGFYNNKSVSATAPNARTSNYHPLNSLLNSSQQFIPCISFQPQHLLCNKFNSLFESTKYNKRSTNAAAIGASLSAQNSSYNNSLSNSNNNPQGFFQQVKERIYQNRRKSRHEASNSSNNNSSQSQPPMTIPSSVNIAQFSSTYSHGINVNHNNNNNTNITLNSSYCNNGGINHNLPFECQPSPKHLTTNQAKSNRTPNNNNNAQKNCSASLTNYNNASCNNHNGTSPSHSNNNNFNISPNNNNSLNNPVDYSFLNQNMKILGQCNSQSPPPMNHNISPIVVAAAAAAATVTTTSSSSQSQNHKFQNKQKQKQNKNQKQDIQLSISQNAQQLSPLSQQQQQQPLSQQQRSSQCPPLSNSRREQDTTKSLNSNGARYSIKSGNSFAGLIQSQQAQQSSSQHCSEDLMTQLARELASTASKSSPKMSMTLPSKGIMSSGLSNISTLSSFEDALDIFLSNGTASETPIEYFSRFLNTLNTVTKKSPGTLLTCSRETTTSPSYQPNVLTYLSSSQPYVKSNVFSASSSTSTAQRPSLTETLKLILERPLQRLIELNQREKRNFDELKKQNQSTLAKHAQETHTLTAQIQKLETFLAMEGMLEQFHASSQFQIIDGNDTTTLRNIIKQQTADLQAAKFKEDQLLELLKSYGIQEVYSKQQQQQQQQQQQTQTHPLKNGGISIPPVKIPFTNSCYIDPAFESFNDNIVTNYQPWQVEEDVIQNESSLEKSGGKRSHSKKRNESTTSQLPFFVSSQNSSEESWRALEEEELQQMQQQQQQNHHQTYFHPRSEDQKQRKPDYSHQEQLSILNQGRKVDQQSTQNRTSHFTEQYAGENPLDSEKDDDQEVQLLLSNHKGEDKSDYKNQRYLPLNNNHSKNQEWEEAFKKPVTKNQQVAAAIVDQRQFNSFGVVVGYEKHPNYSNSQSASATPFDVYGSADKQSNSVTDSESDAISIGVNDFSQICKAQVDSTLKDKLKINLGGLQVNQTGLGLPGIGQSRNEPSHLINGEQSAVQILGYHDEFMNQFEDFSQSWRDAINAERRYDTDQKPISHTFQPQQH